MIDRYIRQYGRRLYGLCLYLCASPADAEDLYQETWLEVIQNQEKYDREKEFEPWLTKICVNTWRNVLRKLRGSPVFDHFSSGEEKERLLESVPDRERKDYSDLYLAVRALPEKLRTAVVLYYFEDMDIRATAEILGIPEGTFMSIASTMILTVLLAGGLLLLLSAVIGLYVWRDASRRKMNPVLWTLVAVIAPAAVSV